MVHALDIKDSFPAAKFTNFADLLNIVIPTLIIVAAFAFLVIMFWGGFTLLTAGGNKEKVDSAKKTITYAVLGLAVIFLSYLGVKLIQFVFNIPGPF